MFFVVFCAAFGHAGRLFAAGEQIGLGYCRLRPRWSAVCRGQTDRVGLLSPSATLVGCLPGADRSGRAIVAFGHAGRLTAAGG